MLDISDHAKQKYEDLDKLGDVHIVPTVSVRCFVPCQFGYCVCSSDIRVANKHFTIVNSDGKIRALEMLNDELSFVRKQFLKKISD